MKICAKLLLVVFFLISCNSQNENKNKNQKNTDSLLSLPNKPDDTVLELNGAQAKQIILSNGLKVILISAPSSKTAAAAVGVAVGSRDNPAEAQGLAHFLEHMLFLGSKEFPATEGFLKFIQSNGGLTNAYTSHDHTNYFFQIRSEKFEEAIHQLSRFFVSPLFDSTFVEREKSAVHNEYNLKLNAFKQYRSIDAFLYEDDPGRLFSTGNNITLKNATAEDTKKMFDEYYYAQAMQVVLAGPESLVELKYLAEKYFSDVKSKNQNLKTHKNFSDFDFAHLPAQINMKASEGEKELMLSLALKSAKVENPKLLQGLGFIIGEQSETSLMVKLQEKGWLLPGANALRAGATSSGLWMVLSLSDLGFQEYKRVINYVKGYLLFLQNTGLPNYLNSELSRLNSVNARSVEYFELDADTVKGLNQMFFSDEWLPENWQELFLGRIYNDIKVEDYQNYLSRIWYDKIFVQLVHPEFQNVNVNYDNYKNLNIGGIGIEDVNGQKVVVDYIYNFAAPVQNFDSELIVAEGDFVLKEENTYMPDSFEVYPDENLDPYFKMQGEWGSFRYSPNPDVNSSKVFLTLDLNSSAIDFNNVEDVAALYLFREMIRNQTASASSAMQTAGFEIAFPISIDKGIIRVELSGWSDTFVKVFQNTLASTHFSLSDQEFGNLKAFYKHNLKMEEAGELDKVGNRLLGSLVTNSYLNYDHLNKSLDGLDKNEFENFISRYFSAFYLDGNLTGNLKKSYVFDIVSAVKENWDPTWNLKENKPASKMSQRDENGNNVLLEAEILGPHPQNSLYMGYLNLGKLDDPKEKWLAIILGQWLSPDFFEELRTQRQLAYALYANYSLFAENKILRMNLLSSTHSADEIQKEVDGYVKQWASEILPLKTEEFLKATVASLNSAYQRPRSSNALHKYMTELFDPNYDSLKDLQEGLKILDSITVQDVIDFGQRQILEKPKSGAFIKIKRKE